MGLTWPEIGNELNIRMDKCDDEKNTIKWKEKLNINGNCEKKVSVVQNFAYFKC